MTLRYKKPLGTNSRLSRIVLALILLVGVLAALRHVPIGTRSYPGAGLEGMHSISVSAPRYLIPREFVYPMQIGDSAGILPFPDPHFAATAPVEFEVVGPGGTSFAVAQGFDVNYRFEQEKLRRSILALQVGGEIYLLDAGETCFRCWGDTRQLFFLGHSDKELAFLLRKPLISSPEIGVLLASWPITQTSTAELTVNDTEGFPAALERVINIGVTENAIEELCRTRSKAISHFVMRYFQRIC